MIDILRMLTVVPGFGGGSSAPPPPPVPLPPPPPPEVPEPPKPPTPVSPEVVAAKKASKKEAQRKRGLTDSIRTGPMGLDDDDANLTKRSLIGS